MRSDDTGLMNDMTVIRRFVLKPTEIEFQTWAEESVAWLHEQGFAAIPPPYEELEGPVNYGEGDGLTYVAEVRGIK